jgi:hypothetical protein
MKKFILILLLLSACQLIPSQTGLPKVVDVRTGTSALDVVFTPGTLSDIFMCGQSDVNLQIRNIGAFDIEKGYYIWIYEPQYFMPLTETSNLFDLKGKSIFNPMGDPALVSFKLKNTGLDKQFDLLDSDLAFRACYAYRTSADVQVCIDPDVQGLNHNKPCVAQPITFSGGQGGPVGVTKVVSYMDPKGDLVSPAFDIYLQHLGAGQVVSKDGAALACTSGKAVGINKVSVTPKIQDFVLTCTPNPVLLEQGVDARVFCKTDASYGLNSGTFTTVLHVDLDYGYVTSAVLPLTVSRLPGQKNCDSE